MNRDQQDELRTLIHRCSTQAYWHQQKYMLFKYYEQYYVYLLSYQQHYYDQQNANTCVETKEDESVNSNEEARDCTEMENDNSEQKTSFIQRGHSMAVQHESPARKKKRKKRKKKPSTHKHNEMIGHNESEDESELELDDGFKEFLKQSEKFRKERDAMKLQSSSILRKDEEGCMEERLHEIVDIEYVDILRKGPDGTILPPTALNRKKLYEEKYGTSSGTTILSLETALQWKYNKFIDQNRPVMWPAIPLRFT